MRKIHTESRNAKSLLLPMAVAGMIAGFTIGCSEEKPAAPAAPASASKPAAEKPAAEQAGAEETAPEAPEGGDA